MKDKQYFEEVLFLDIDGVMSRCEYGKDLYADTYHSFPTALHRQSIVALKELLDRHPAMSVVWISDWAKGQNPYGKGCVLNPLDVLELYPWITSRTYGKTLMKMSANRVDGIVKFLKEHVVKSFAILDDDCSAYPNANDNDIGWIRRNYVRIDPTKAFTMNDISLVDDALCFPMAGKYLHSLLLELDHNDIFIINRRYKCSFDMFKTTSYEPLFSLWEKDPMCLNREECSTEVVVYDCNEHINLVGKIVLAHNADLANSRYTADICLKPFGSDVWTSGVSISNFKYFNNEQTRNA